MKANPSEATPQTTEQQAEPKKYHPPELTVYGDLREMTLTNPVVSSRDTGVPELEVTTS